MTTSDSDQQEDLEQLRQRLTELRKVFYQAPLSNLTLPNGEAVRVYTILESDVKDLL
jgi:hypothetical protein